MREAVIRIDAFPAGGGCWRIDWFGDVCYPNRAVRSRQPSIRVMLSPVADHYIVGTPETLSPAWQSDPERQIEVEVSVGTLVLLRIGDIWQHKEPVCRPDYNREVFNSVQIYSSTARLLKVGHSLDSGAFLLPLAEHPWHRQHTHSQAMVVTLADGVRLVVPCAELIRFYYGSSASLLSKLFMPPLERSSLYTAAEFDETTKRLFLKLAPGIRGSSAADIGRMCLHEKAWTEAIRVGSSILDATNPQRLRYPKCMFPFFGRTDFTVTGKWLNQTRGEPRTFIVYSIRSCSHQFPFVSLRYETQDLDSRAGDGSGDTNKRNRTAARDAGNQSLVEQDASNSLAPKVKRVFDDIRFTDLQRKKIWCAEETPDDPAAALVEYGGDAPEIAAAALGVGGSENRVRPIDIEIIPLVKKLSNKPPPLFLLPFLEELEKLHRFEIALLTNDRRDGWTYAYFLYSEATEITSPARVAIFSIQNARLGTAVLSTDSARPGELAIKQLNSNELRNPAEVLALVAELVDCKTHPVASLSTTVAQFFNSSFRVESPSD